MQPECTLKVLFDRDDKGYHPGEQVKGHVEVEVTETCSCPGLELTVGWRTHGRGNVDRGSEQSEILFEGEWAANEVHRHPFAFELPNGPFTYRGHFLNVDWNARATVTVPGIGNLQAREDFLLTASPEGTSAPYHSHDPRGPEGSLQARQDSSEPADIVFAVLFIAALVLGCWIFVWITDDPEAFSISEALTVFMGIVVALALALSLGIRNRLANARLRSIAVAVDNPGVHAGEHLGFSIEIPPKSKAHINGISANLIGQEVVTSGAGSRRTTRTHTVHNDGYTFPETVDRSLKRGESLDIRDSIVVPTDAPPSFHADDNHLEWKLRIHVDIHRWPDWQREYPLEVLPSLPAPEEAEEAEEAEESNPVG